MLTTSSCLSDRTMNGPCGIQFKTEWVLASTTGPKLDLHWEQIANNVLAVNGFSITLNNVFVGLVCLGNGQPYLDFNFRWLNIATCLRTQGIAGYRCDSAEKNAFFCEDHSEIFTRKGKRSGSFITNQRWDKINKIKSLVFDVMPLKIGQKKKKENLAID